MTLVDFIRAIQKAEDNHDCFKRCRQTCSKKDCFWWEYCCGSCKDSTDCLGALRSYMLRGKLVEETFKAEPIWKSERE